MTGMIAGVGQDGGVGMAAHPARVHGADMRAGTMLLRQVGWIGASGTLYAMSPTGARPHVEAEPGGFSPLWQQVGVIELNPDAVGRLAREVAYGNTDRIIPSVDWDGLTEGQREDWIAAGMKIAGPVLDGHLRHGLTMMKD